MAKDILDKELKSILLSYEEPLFSWFLEQGSKPKYGKFNKEAVKEFQAEVIEELKKYISLSQQQTREEVLNEIEKFVLDSDPNPEVGRVPHYEQGFSDACNTILVFLDSLSNQPKNKP